MSWLPTHQHHVVYTLAHVDELIEQTGNVLFDYLRSGVFGLETVADGDLAHVRITHVEPLPESVARKAAAALTQLRAALEHTLFAEVAYQVGRDLTEAESRRIEMPAATSATDFDKWATSRKRQEMDAFRVGSTLLQRMRDLQPFQRRDIDGHPLSLLAEHTNLAKHRTPSVAATRLGAVIPDHQMSALITPGEPRPITAGDVIATGPLYERVPISIWPTVSVRRPHSGTWHTVMNELGYIEAWVRTVAIPHLILGRSDVEELPPRVDSSVGHEDFEAALATRTTATAAERSMTRIQATTVREALVETLALDPSGPDVSKLTAWVAALDDAEVLERQDRLGTVAKRQDLPAVQRVVQELLDEARAGGRSD